LGEEGGQEREKNRSLAPQGKEALVLAAGASPLVQEGKTQKKGLFGLGWHTSERR